MCQSSNPGQAQTTCEGELGITSAYRGDFFLLSSTFIFLHISTMIIHVKNKYISTKFLCSYKHKIYKNRKIQITKLDSSKRTPSNMDGSYNILNTGNSASLLDEKLP